MGFHDEPYEEADGKGRKRLLDSGGGKIRIVNSKCGSTLFLRYEKRL